MAIKKILCFCGSGVGSSFLLDMNIKTVLKNHNITDIEVEHSTIDDVMPGAADLFVCGSDFIEKAESAGLAIGLDNMVSLEELDQKLMKVLESV